MATQSYKINKINPNICYIKRLELTPSGIRYLPQQIEMGNRILRKYYNQTHLFYRVNCVNAQGLELHNSNQIQTFFYRDLLNNLEICGKKLEFLAYSASQLKKGQCWFLQQQYNLNAKTLIRQEGDFSSIYPTSKRAARIGQLLSTSLPVNSINMEKVNVKTEPDIKSPIDQTKIFSDGIGIISSDLIQKVYQELFSADSNIHNLSAIQIRYQGAKGVLASLPTLPTNTIILRESMIKFKKAPIANLEVLEFNKYRPGFLNRQIIILLLTLGVPDSAFVELQQEAIQDLHNFNLKDRNIFKYFNQEQIEENEFASLQALIRNIINAGIDIENEPFVQGIITTYRNSAYMHLKSKSNILVKKAARLLGVLDEYGILNENEIFVTICQDNTTEIEYISGKVCITKNPCIHPGDIRVVTAINNEKTRKGFAHLINCVVFPQKGNIPLTCQISGSDLDGDQYFVTWDERLLPAKNCQPLNYDEDKKFAPPQQQEKIQQSDYLDFFFEYQNSDNLGSIANSHQAFAN
eukprot:TRINITY_DN6753_c0_g2_i1.p1 TRINITY_DN6753_c0_g2~~TRINITY_DN6753_c0_g2_i1.p1  ORF type:complete len:522 (+),score=59.67 TRINITY_DN6753_c0_g2_i1:290-1855(+)